MMKQLTAAVGMVLLVSSFALAGQGPTAPRTQGSVAQAQTNQARKHARHGKKHHKRHHRHHAAAARR